MRYSDEEKQRIIDFYHLHTGKECAERFGMSLTFYGLIAFWHIRKTDSVRVPRVHRSYESIGVEDSEPKFCQHPLVLEGTIPWPTPAEMMRNGVPARRRECRKHLPEDMQCTA